MLKFPARLATAAAGAVLVLGLAACAGDLPTDTSSTRDPAVALKPAAAPGRDTPVTSTIADGGYQIGSDGAGSYSNANGVSSIIQIAGDWTLDLTASRVTRKIRLTFNRISGSGDLPADGLYKSRLISKCSLRSQNWRMIPLNGTVQCPLHLAFDWGGSSYALQMNSTGVNSWPGTDDANISCNASAGGTCTNWTMTPSTPGGSNVAVLLKYVSSTPVVQGYFSVGFLIGVTTP